MGVSAKQSKVGGHLPGLYTETDPEMQMLTRKEFKAFEQWEVLLFTSESTLRI